MISIRKHGSIGFSQGALNRFALLDGDWFVVLFYDKNAAVIGIQPTKDASEEGAIKLIKRKAKLAKSAKESISSSVAARAFLEYYGIPCDKSRAYRAKWSETEKMILLDLNEEVSDPESKDDSQDDFAHASGQADVGNQDSVAKTA